MNARDRAGHGRLASIPGAWLSALFLLTAASHGSARAGGFSECISRGLGSWSERGGLRKPRLSEVDRIRGEIEGRWASDPEVFDPAWTASPEGVIALLEAGSRVEPGVAPNSTVARLGEWVGILEGKTRLSRQDRQALKELRKLDPARIWEHGTYLAKAERDVLRFHRLVSGISYGSPRLGLHRRFVTAAVRRFGPERLDVVIQRRAEEEILTQGWVAMLARLGHIRDPRGLEKLRAFRDRHALAEDLLVSAAISAAAVSQVGVMGIRLPRARVASRVRIPPELLARIRLQGFESAVPELRRLFGGSVRADQAIAVARRLVSTALAVYAVKVLLEIYPALRMVWAFATEEKVTPEELRAQADGMSDDGIRAMLLESWRDTFLLFNELERVPAAGEPLYEEFHREQQAEEARIAALAHAELRELIE